MASIDVVEDVAEGLRKAIRVLSEAREKLTNLVDFPGDESVSAVSTGEND